jgi:hypothetical protein
VKNDIRLFCGRQSAVGRLAGAIGVGGRDARVPDELLSIEHCGQMDLNTPHRPPQLLLIREKTSPTLL